jgi:CD109 antigen
MLLYYLDFRSKIYQEFEVAVPNSVTPWVATAFVISEELGLRLSTAPVEVGSMLKGFSLMLECH